jgi:hypothetical protein
MAQSKRMAALGFGLFVFWAGREAQAQSRTGLIQSARTQEEANLTPWAKPIAERVIEEALNSLPYRLLTGEAHGFGV